MIMSHINLNSSLHWYTLNTTNYDELVNSSKQKTTFHFEWNAMSVKTYIYY